MNNKLSYDLLEKILDQATAPTEIDFILYLSKIQNEFGNIRNLHYADVCLYLNISKQTFYNIKNSLESKKIIRVDWTNQINWNITLLDNQFINYNDYKQGYINTNKDFLYTPEFKNLKLQEKKLVLKLLKVSRADATFKISIPKLKEWLGTDNKNLIVSYINNISKFFDITVSNDNVLYIFKLSLKSNVAEKTEKENYLLYAITTYCRMHKISYTIDDLKDLVIMFGQYKNKLNKLIQAIIDTCLHYHCIIPKLINSIVSHA